MHDTLRLADPLQVDSLELARTFTGIHMGSAKYFHPSESSAIALPLTNGLAQELTRARTCEVRFAIHCASQVGDGRGMTR